MEPAAGPLLSYEEVSVHYDGAARPAVDRVSFEIGYGDRLAVLGLNGSGKTTLLLTPSGLIPFTGRITVAGMEVSDERMADIRRMTGYLFAIPEDQILFPRVLDDVMFSLCREGRRDGGVEEEAREMLASLGIGELAGHNPHYLSHGERTRVALAGALAGETGLLLLDEPAAALDPPGRRDLARLLSGLGKSMVIATHDIAFARAASTHFTVLHEGRLAGPVRPVWELPGEPGEIWPEE